MHPENESECICMFEGDRGIRREWHTGRESKWERERERERAWSSDRQRQIEIDNALGV